MKNTFKKGLILGGILAAGAVIGLSFTDEGKELTEELKKDLKALAKQLKKGLHKLEDVTKENFDVLVDKIVDEYTAKKELALDAKDALTSALRSQWHQMEEEYLSEKD